jgi:hypothetical protein
MAQPLSLDLLLQSEAVEAVSEMQVPELPVDLVEVAPIIPD